MPHVKLRIIEGHAAISPNIEVTMRQMRSKLARSQNMRSFRESDAR